jgi:Ni,Fe-hydrogenase III small subunit/NAD-dependent dihydropyrimidine dehydrogenase PreA subunit
MIKTLLARIHQGYRTMSYPKTLPPLPDRFRGAPAFDPSACASGCNACAQTCPTRSISCENGPVLDLGSCIFCGECAKTCPAGAITFTGNHQLASDKRENLLSLGAAAVPLSPCDAKRRGLFKKSLKLRQVCAGGCNACEADINVLSTIGWDLGRFGIQIVASPRHADGLIITGPVTENMKLALQKTYDAVPSPKIVIAIGTCAISGGIYRDSPAQHCGAASVVPVDLFIPGCPPHPLTILDGILRFTGRL